MVEEHALPAARAQVRGVRRVGRRRAPEPLGQRGAARRLLLILSAFLAPAPLGQPHRRGARVGPRRHEEHHRPRRVVEAQLVHDGVADVVVRGRRHRQAALVDARPALGPGARRDLLGGGHHSPRHRRREGQVDGDGGGALGRLVEARAQPRRQRPQVRRRRRARDHGRADARHLAQEALERRAAVRPHLVDLVDAHAREPFPRLRMRMVRCVRWQETPVRERARRRPSPAAPGGTGPRSPRCTRRGRSARRRSAREASAPSTLRARAARPRPRRGTRGRASRTTRRPRNGAPARPPSRPRARASARRRARRAACGRGATARARAAPPRPASCRPRPARCRPSSCGPRLAAAPATATRTACRSRTAPHSARRRAGPACRTLRPATACPRRPRGSVPAAASV